MIKFVGLAQKDKEVLLYFLQTEGGQNFFKVVSSHNGFEFADKCKYVFAMDLLQHEEQSYDWKSFRIAKQDREYFLTYKPDGEKDSHLLDAVSTNLVLWQKMGQVDSIKETAAIVPNYQYKEEYVMYFGQGDIKVAFSKDLHTWQPDAKIILGPRQDSFDSAGLEVGNAHLMDGHILLTYFAKKHTGDKTQYFAGAALFDRANPLKLLWRSEEPLWEQPEELSGNIHPLGSAIIGSELVLYWLIGESSLYAVSCEIPTVNTDLKKKPFSAFINKFRKNPIIAPIPSHPWESRATFNSAAVLADGKVHFIYRALGDKDLSVLGYATSTDGLTIDERFDEPIYIPREPFETPGGNMYATFADHFASGGGYGGIEDPRITQVDDRLYLTYVAFDGANPPRSALSSIHMDDFRKKRWDKWEKPKLMSAPGMVNKSAVIFPKKVNGKYVVLHRVYPNILVDFLDDLEFNQYLTGHAFIPPRKNFWDSKKVGAGAQPMETKDGWLLIYQSVGHQDSSRYKIGAMMLDRNNPSKVLYRTHSPIIEPNESYENDGFKAGVVYPCGAVIMDNTLNIYYGGADTVVCAATT